MIRKIMLSAFFLVIGLTLSGQSEEDKYAYRVKQISGPIQVDGKLNEPSWSSANVLTGFEGVLGAGKIEHQSFVRVLYSKDTLYIGVEFQEPRVSELAARSKGNIWGSDRIEFPLDPRPEDVEYYLFGVNCDGDKEEGVFGSPEYDDGVAEWNPPWDTAVSKGEDRWYIEIGIPFNTLKSTPKKGDVWKINFCRQRSPGNTKVIYSAWIKKYSGFHYAGGKLIFE